MRGGGAAVSASDIWALMQNQEVIGEDVAVQSGNINVWGSWTQLVAATTKDIYFVSVSIGEIDDAAKFMQVELAIGAALSEVPIGGYGAYYDETDDIGGNTGKAWPVYIPAGSRVSIRTMVRGVVNNIGCMAFVVGMTE